MESDCDTSKNITSGCFHPNTMILLSDGHYKSCKTIVKGDVLGIVNLLIIKSGIVNILFLYFVMEHKINETKKKYKLAMAIIWQQSYVRS
jgi:hypothetical protein